MLTIDRTLDELVTAALDELVGIHENGQRIVAASTLDADDVSLTLAAGPVVSVTNVLQFGWECLLVTAKSDDATPIYTVVRGWDGTTAAAITTGDEGVLNPMFTRRRVADIVKVALNRMDAQGIPCQTSVVLNREEDLQHALLPDDCKQVVDVNYLGTDGHIYPVPKWQEYHTLPTAVFTNGKVLVLPREIADEDDIMVTYRKPYRWSSYPAEPEPDDTIELPEGVQDLPVLYAVARLYTRRELSRNQLDRQAEWSATQQTTGGISTGLVKQLWADWYRSVDEAKRLFPPPILRPFKRMRKTF